MHLHRFRHRDVFLMHEYRRMPLLRRPCRTPEMVEMTVRSDDKNLLARERMNIVIQHLLLVLIGAGRVDEQHRPAISRLGF